MGENKIKFLWTDTYFGIFVAEWKYLQVLQRLREDRIKHQLACFDTLTSVRYFIEINFSYVLEIESSHIKINKWTKYRTPYWTVFFDGYQTEIYRYNEWEDVRISEGGRISLGQIRFFDSFEEALEELIRNKQIIALRKE